MLEASTGNEVDELARSVSRLETAIARIDAMLQQQGRQATATLDSVAGLKDAFSLIIAGVSAAASRLDAPRAPDETFLVVRPLGQVGNRMIQHMVAMSIAAKVPGARISRVHLPEWGREEPEIAGAPQVQLDIQTMRVDVDALAGRMRRGELKAVAISGYAQNIANFLEADAYRSTFVGPPDIVGYGPKILLISLRMAEILSANYPPYVLLPIAFYRQLIEETGLTPVFFGQLTPSPYLDDLKQAFPNARFVDGRGVIHDFETIRRSHNIVVSISTFTWLAAWLSESQRVFLPLAGLFNPIFGRLYSGGHDLVPRDDARYRMFLFPLGMALEQSRLPAYHASIEGMWREVTSREIDASLHGENLVERSIDKNLALFDEEFYLRRYGEIRNAVAVGHVQSGRHHYELHGMWEGRDPFEVDMEYMIRYPDAGLAVSNGEFANLTHFHAERGHALGYVPTSR